MLQLLPTDSDQHSAPPPSVEEEVSAASAELIRLLLQRVELSNDIARMRKLIARLAQNADSHRMGKSRRVRGSARSSSSPDYRRRPIARSTPPPGHLQMPGTRARYGQN